MYIRNIGTPIQNNLEELFSVVQFTSPGYLGTLQEFKKEYSDPIDKGRDPQASKKSIEAGTKATAALKLRMAHILLRRTRDAVLQAILPLRRDYLLHCDMSVPQRDQYLRECILLFECLHGNNSHSGVSHREEKSIAVKNDSDFDDNSDGDINDDEIDQNDDCMSGKKSEVSKNVSKKGRKLDNSKGMNALGIGSGVLPNIMQLRQICDFATWDGELDSHIGNDRSGATTDEDKENVQLLDSKNSINDSSSEGFGKEEEREKVCINL